MIPINERKSAGDRLGCNLLQNETVASIMWSAPSIPSNLRLFLGLSLLTLIGYPWFAAAQQLPPQGAAAGKQSRIELPQGWTVYRDEAGLVVPHPVGWRVRSLGRGGFLVYRYDEAQGATAVAYVMPLASIEGTPGGVVRGLGQIAPDVFPDVQVSSVRTVSRVPAVAVGGLQYSPKGSPFVGTVMCYTYGGRGVLYAIAARQSQ